MDQCWGAVHLRMSLPIPTSHRRVVTPLTEAKDLPSGENATDSTAPDPASVQMSLPVTASDNRIVWLSLADAKASCHPAKMPRSGHTSDGPTRCGFPCLCQYPRGGRYCRNSPKPGFSHRVKMLPNEWEADARATCGFLCRSQPPIGGILPVKTPGQDFSRPVKKRLTKRNHHVANEAKGRGGETPQSPTVPYRRESSRRTTTNGHVSCSFSVSLE